MNSEYTINQLRSQKIDFFEYLLITYEKDVYTFIYHMVHNKYTAQDLTQEVFIRVYKKIDILKTDYPIKAWLFKTAYNITLTQIKKNKNNGISYETDDIASKTDYIKDCEDKILILKEIECFKADSRAILYMRMVEDLSFEQIAVMLGKTVVAVKMRFYRCKKVLENKLREAFKER